MKQFYLLFFSLSIFITPALAQESSWSSDSQARARILSSIDSIAPQTTQFDAAIEVDFGQGWHSYWRAPGEAGLPPSIDWNASDNIKELEMHWPAPKRKDEIGLTVFGYSDSVVFPISIKPEDTSKPVNLDLDLDVMVCKDICIPQQIKLNLSLPAGHGQKIAMARRIEKAKEKVPPYEHSKLKISRIITGPKAVVLEVYDENEFENFDIYAFIEGDNFAFTDSPIIAQDKKDKRKALVTLPQSEFENLIENMKDKSARIVIVSGKNALVNVFNF